MQADKRIYPKCIITYLQCKRVSLPYIFGKYCFPKMKQTYPGEMELYHIHHNVNYTQGGLSSSLNLNERNLDNVRKFIIQGKYPNAEIRVHEEVNNEFALIPSTIKAAELALERKAELHLWLEDDAIVFDLDCWQWPQLIACEIGCYRHTMNQKMLVCAYYVSRTSFDKRLIEQLPNYKKEEHAKYAKFGSQYEHLLFNIANQKMSYLNENNAFRHHPYGKFHKNRFDLEKWLKEKLPITKEDLDLLKLDFNANLPP